MLKSVWSLFLVEAHKQSRLKLPYIGLAAIAAMAAMWPQLQRNFTDTAIPVTGYEFVTDAMLSITTLMVPIFSAIFAATLVAGETSSGTMRYMLCRPVTRLSFLSAKFLAGFVYTAVMIAVTGAVLAVVGAMVIGYGGARDAMLGVELAPMEFWPRLALAATLSLVPAFATTAYGLWLSTLFRNSGAAVGVSVGGLVVLERLKYFFQWDDLAAPAWLGGGDLPEWLADFKLTTWLWTDYYDTALTQVSNLASGTFEKWNSPELWASLVVPAVWIALFVAISSRIMNRRDWG